MLVGQPRGGVGGGAIVAYHAAVDGHVRGVAACDALASYRSIVDAPRYTHPVADFVPGALPAYDLPDLAGALAPASVLVLNPQDALGEPLDRAAADAAFERATVLSALLGGTLAVIARLDAAGQRQAVVRWAEEVSRTSQGKRTGDG